MDEVPELIQADNYKFSIPAIPVGIKYLLTSGDTGILNHKPIHCFEEITDENEKFFWYCVRINKLPDSLINFFDVNSNDDIEYYEQLDVLNNVHKQLIIRGAYAISNYFDCNSINDPRFYKDINDPCDGISMGSDTIIDFIESLIMQGKDDFNDFCINPFNGDIMSYLSRTVSCGNSSYLTFKECCNKRWWHLLKSDYNEILFDTKFCNYIFSIIRPKKLLC